MEEIHTSWFLVFSSWQSAEILAKYQLHLHPPTCAPCYSTTQKTTSFGEKICRHKSNWDYAESNFFQWFTGFFFWAQPKLVRTREIWKQNVVQTLQDSNSKASFGIPDLTSLPIWPQKAVQPKLSPSNTL